MKKNKLFPILTLAILFIAAGCNKKFDEYSVDPNKPISVPAYLLLRQIENDIVVFPAGDEDKFGQFTLSSYTYYGTNEYWTGAANSIVAQSA